MAKSSPDIAHKPLATRVYHALDFISRAGISYKDPSTNSEAEEPNPEDGAEQAEAEKRDARAMGIAKAAQESIGEAYRSPHTLNTAYEAARIALEQVMTEQGEQ